MATRAVVAVAPVWGVLATADAARAGDTLSVRYQLPNLSAGPNCLVGLKSDGTVIASPGAGDSQPCRPVSLHTIPRAVHE